MSSPRSPPPPSLSLDNAISFEIFIWQYKDNDLQGIAFLDLHYYIHSVSAIRSLTLACDVFASLSLVRFQVR